MAFHDLRVFGISVFYVADDAFHHVLQGDNAQTRAVFVANKASRDVLGLHLLQHLVNAGVLMEIRGRADEFFQGEVLVVQCHEEVFQKCQSTDVVYAAFGDGIHLVEVFAYHGLYLLCALSEVQTDEVVLGGHYGTYGQVAHHEDAVHKVFLHGLDFTVVLAFLYDGLYLLFRHLASLVAKAYQ